MMPYKLFLMLLDPSNSVDVLDTPECMRDPFATKHLELYDTPEALESQESLEVLKCVAWGLCTDTISIEKRHAEIRRNLKEASIEAAPTPLRETFGSSPYSLGRVLARDDAPRKEVMLGEASFSVGWERFVVLFTPRNSHRRRAIPIHTAQFLLSTGSSLPRSSSTPRR